jgi:hypothetical protein
MSVDVSRVLSLCDMIVLGDKVPKELIMPWLKVEAQAILTDYEKTIEKMAEGEGFRRETH